MKNIKTFSKMVKTFNNRIKHINESGVPNIDTSGYTDMFKYFEEEKSKPSVKDMHDYLADNYPDYIYTNDKVEHTSEDKEDAASTELFTFWNEWNRIKAKPDKKTKDVIVIPQWKKDERGRWVFKNDADGRPMYDNDGRPEHLNEDVSYDKSKFINYIDILAALMPSPTELGLPNDTGLRYAELEKEDHNNDSKDEHGTQWKSWWYLYLYIGERTPSGDTVFHHYNVISLRPEDNSFEDNEEYNLINHNLDKKVYSKYSRFFTLYHRKSIGKDVARRWMHAYNMNKVYVNKVDVIVKSLKSLITVINKETPDFKEDSNTLYFNINNQSGNGWQVMLADYEYMHEKIKDICENLGETSEGFRGKKLMHCKLVYTEYPVTGLLLNNGDDYLFKFTRIGKTNNVDVKYTTQERTISWGKLQIQSYKSITERTKYTESDILGIYYETNALATIKNITVDSKLVIKDAYENGIVVDDRFVEAHGGWFWIVPTREDVSKMNKNFDKLLFWMARLPFKTSGAAMLYAEKAGFKIVNKPKNPVSTKDKLYGCGVTENPFIFSYVFKVPFTNMQMPDGTEIEAGELFDSSTDANMRLYGGRCYDFAMTDVEAQAKRNFLTEYSKFFKKSIEDHIAVMLQTEGSVAELAEQLREELLGIYDLQIIKPPENILVHDDDGGITVEFNDWINSPLINIGNKIITNPRANKEILNKLTLCYGANSFDVNYHNGSKKPNMPTDARSLTNYIKYLVNYLRVRSVNESIDYENNEMLNENGIIQFSLHLLDLCI